MKKVTELAAMASRKLEDEFRGKMESEADFARRSKEFVQKLKPPSTKHLFRIDRQTQIAVPERVLNGAVCRKEWERKMILTYGKPLNIK